MADFFISYTSADQDWAEWIAYVLEEEGFDVIIQAWDFRPGSNFVLEMQKAASTAERTVMVLSPDYLKSQFASPEWAAAFAQDPQGLARKLVPIMVRRCSPPGLLASIVYVSVTDEDEATARDRLLKGVNAGRAKPTKRPSFPGTTTKRTPKAFPGPSTTSPYMPKLRRPATDVEKRRFTKETFSAIKAHFERGLAELAAHADGIECDFEPTTTTEFTAEVFVNGRSRCRCRVWQGGMHSPNGISYAEGTTGLYGDACNEVLSISDEGAELHVASLMGDMGF